MTIDQLRAFVRCAELGGISPAARVEKLPKSTVSRLLGELETELGVRLMARSSRGLLLTSEGAIFLPHARQVLEDVDVAAASLRSVAADPSGVVRVTAPYTFGVTFIAPLLPAFMAAYPAVDIHLDLTSRNVDLTEEGYDLGVRIGPPPPAMVALHLMSNPLLFCATPGYLAHRPEPLEPEDLRRHALLLIGSPRSRTALRLTGPGREALITASPRLLSSDPAVVVQAALAGAGIGQAPRILVQSILDSGLLVPVLRDWASPAADISLLFASHRPLPSRVRVFIDYLRSGIRKA